VPTLLSAAAAVLALLAGCAAAPGGSGSTGGAVTFRPTDTGIWALDYATALRLLAIGVVPEHAARFGFRRPPSQSGRGNEFGFSSISPEELSRQTADVVIDLQGSVAFGGTSPLDDPLLDVSGSVTGRVDFNAWYGTGPLHTVWVLHDLDAVLFGDGTTATAEDGPALWATVIGAA
jgi:hypothetical protein